MEAVVDLARADAHTEESPVRVLVADDDGPSRSLLAATARDVVGEIVVLEAEDGAEAVQVGLQQRPAVALLDVNMPRLDGVEAAVTLRGLQPRMRLALYTADPLRHRERAREHRLPLFDKLELEDTLAWLHAQVEWTRAEPEPAAPPKHDLVCGGCGYGIMRATPPDQCPMCQAENDWVLAVSRRSIPVLTS